MQLCPTSVPRLIKLGIAAIFCYLAAIPVYSGPTASTDAAETPSQGPASTRRGALPLDSFTAQRSYGLGRIPEDAVLKAVAQRDAMKPRQPRFTGQEENGARAAANQWISIGPTAINSPTRGLISGRVPSLAVDPASPSTVYIASAGGGVWKSVNRGSGWVPLTDSLPSLASGAVAVDPFTGALWYGTGELNFCRDCYYGAGVFRSADGGTNWSRVAPDIFLSSPTSIIVFDRKNQGTLFIGRSTALWKSSDSGQSWRAVLLGVITDFVLNPVDSNIAYAAAGNAFGSPANGVYKSTDGGQTWLRLEGGLPDQSTMGRIALAADPSSPATVYALIARSSDFLLNGLYRSLDGGNTWSILGNLPQEITLEAQFANGLFNLMVAVDPKNPAVIYAGSTDLWKSSDNGASWQNLHISEGMHDLVFDPSDPQTFYLSTNGGVWKSSDGGQSFTDLNPTLGITQFQTVGLHPNNPNLAVGATQDHGTVLYSGGFAWNQGRLGDSGTAFYASGNPQTIYASGHYTDLFRSDDGGKTWPLIIQGIDPNDRALFYSPFLQDPTQPSVLYFATQRVWRSQDRGNRWTPLSADLTGGGSASISTLVFSPASPQTLWAGTTDGRVQISADSGKNWTVAAALPDRFITSLAIQPQNPLQALVGLSGFGTGHIFRTDDRGASWIDISNNLPDIPVNAILIDAFAPERVYLGTDIGVFVLAGDGSWSPVMQGLPNAIVLGLSQNPATGMLIAATHGRGVFALAGSLKAPYLDALVNAASQAQTPLAPGMSVNLRGANLVNGGATASLTFPLPFPLAGSSVTVNGVSAPLFSVSPGQVSFLVPYGIKGNLADVTLSNSSGQATVLVPRVDASPGIFQTGGDGNIVHTNGALVTEAAPARAGEEVVLFATGLGAVDQNVSSGAPSPSPAAKTLLQPIVRAGTLQANVLFSGLTPGLIATYQVNFVVPSGLSGKVPVVLEVGGGILSNTVLMSASQ